MANKKTQQAGQSSNSAKSIPVKSASVKKSSIQTKKRVSVTEEEKKEALLKVAASLDKLLNKKQFITVTSGGSTMIPDLESSPKKTWKTLKTLFSEAPGAIQCATVIRNRMLGGGFYITPVDEKNEIDENDEEYIRLKDFIEEPNPEETLEDVFSSLIWNYWCYGTSYLEKVFDNTNKALNNGKGMLTQIFVLEVEKMKILLDKDLRENGVDLVIGYSREIGNKRKKIIYDVNEVFHYRRPSPDANVYGQAVLENQQGLLAMAIQAITYNVNFLKNDGKQPLQINLPDTTGAAEGEAFQAYYEKHYTGPANAGRTLILYGGAEAKELGSSLKDMDYANLIKMVKIAVSGAFGVPLVMISDPEGTNRASSIEERKGFHVNLILPERKKFLKKFNKDIVKEGLGITKYKLDLEEIDVEDQGKLTTEGNVAMSNGMATPNEAFEYAGWERVNEEWADKKILISNGKAVILNDQYFKDQETMRQNIANQTGNNNQNGNENSAPNNNQNSKKPVSDAQQKENQRKQEEERRRKEKEQKKSINEEISALRDKINKHLYY